MKEYPSVYDEDKVGTYQGLAKAGGGYVWDEVLEYRVWCHPELGAEDLADGDDYYYVFKSFNQANEFSTSTKGTEEPLALILQREYIDEPEPGKYIHMKEERITEWPVAFLSRPRRDENTLPNFFAPDAPANRLDIIRGINEFSANEDIFVSELDEKANKAIVIEGDQHTIWAYLIEIVDDEQEILLDGFICSLGTIVESSEKVKNYISQDFQPPLLKEFKNQFSIHREVSNEDLTIEWGGDTNIAKVYLKGSLYLIMDIKNQQSYSKGISEVGPYGQPLENMRLHEQ